MLTEPQYTSMPQSSVGEMQKSIMHTRIKTDLGAVQIPGGKDPEELLEFKDL